MKIGIFSDGFNVNSGYGRVGLNLAKQFRNAGHDVANFSFSIKMPPMMFKGFPIYPAGNLSYIRKSLIAWKPDVIIHIRDLFITLPQYNKERLSYSIRAATGKIPVVNYTPVESAPIMVDLLEAEKEGDFTVTMTEYGAKALIEGGFNSNKVDYVWHGVNPLEYHPVDENNRKLFGFPEDKTIIMVIGTNISARKMLPLSMKAFEVYLHNYNPNAMLYMHTQAINHYHLPNVATELGISRNVIIQPQFGSEVEYWGLDDVNLNKLYNTADCYLHLPCAEGFGMTEIEVMATGLPAVVSDFPVHREVMGNYPLYAETHRWYPITYGLQWIANPEDAAACIDKAIRGGRKNSKIVYFWEDAAKKFEGILKQVV